MNDPSIREHPRDAYRFKSREQVELLARVMRKWDEDDVPDPAAVAFGEFIVKVRTRSVVCVPSSF